MLRVFRSKRKIDEITPDELQPSEKNEGIKKQKINSAERKQERLEWLKRVNYSQKRDEVIAASSEAKRLKAALEADSENEQNIGEFGDTLRRLSRALQEYDQCLATRSETGFKNFLKQQINYDSIKALSVSSELLLQAANEKKQKINSDQRKQERNEWLKQVNYSQKRDEVIAAYSAVLKYSKAALESDTNERQNNEKLDDALRKLAQALQQYDECLVSSPSMKFKNFLKEKMEYNRIRALSASSDLLLQIVSKIASVRNTIATEAEIVDRFKREIEQIIEERFKNLEDFNEEDIVVANQLLHIQMQMNSIVDLSKNACNEIRFSLQKNHAIVSIFSQENTVYDKLIDLLSTPLRQLQHNNAEKFFEKAQEMKKQYGLYQKMCVIYAKLPPRNPYVNYFQRQIELVKQNIIDLKIELRKMGKQESVSTQTIPALSFFAKTMSQVALNTPITTWERHTDTSNQEFFLKHFLNDRWIKSALQSLKKEAFNISFLEYLENGEYKILFAISGSNDALSDPYHTQKRNMKGINGLVTDWVKSWNKEHPGITFQYVESYNGSNLGMDDGFWYCSEPKLSIEYSKMRRTRAPQERIGQNNWSIDPTTFSAQEQDACTRHCQPRQRELLEYSARPGSPLRVVN
ncbi:Uncharacterised protein [Legionella lansingensis]|uniref:Uncharacterized protein n=1 Tax=Legionella lansingensis TaxID=45067 RepID=A0A0W0VSE2_9GAMM|nr:hypothetical protein [Legionella lansingensis]KTD22877.1 hypothetical protein Llan_0994 [Legionella lansingensis]SNV53740.1 Uncharacterised protein [Legionella lansingensis]